MTGEQQQMLLLAIQFSAIVFAAVGGVIVWKNYRILPLGFFVPLLIFKLFAYTLMFSVRAIAWLTAHGESAGWINRFDLTFAPFAPLAISVCIMLFSVMFVYSLHKYIELVKDNVSLAAKLKVFWEQSAKNGT